MQTSDAYRAGFMLKCASMGIPSEFAQVLYAHPAIVKRAFIGAAYNAAKDAGKGLLGAAGETVDFFGRTGESLASGEQPGVPSKKLQLPASVGEDILRKMLMSAYYQRARQSLAATSPTA